MGRARRLSVTLCAAALLASGCRRGQGDETTDATPARPRPAAEPAPSAADPEALGVIVAAAPRDRLGATAPDGGTLVGSPSDPDAGADVKQAEPIDYRPPRPHVSGPSLELGSATTLGLSSPAIERAAREQIYWQLVQECPGPDGELLPPDAVILEFLIRFDGTIDPGSVKVTAPRAEHAAAAECMQRKFATMPFRAPSPSVSAQTPVRATLPSVD